jgi:hypothetical protein
MAVRKEQSKDSLKWNAICKRQAVRGFSYDKFKEWPIAQSLGKFHHSNLTFGRSRLAQICRPLKSQDGTSFPLAQRLCFSHPAVFYNSHYITCTIPPNLSHNASISLMVVNVYNNNVSLRVPQTRLGQLNVSGQYTIMLWKKLCCFKPWNFEFLDKCSKAVCWWPSFWAFSSFSITIWSTMDPWIRVFPPGNFRCFSHYSWTLYLANEWNDKFSDSAIIDCNVGSSTSDFALRCIQNILGILGDCWIRSAYENLPSQNASVCDEAFQQKMSRKGSSMILIIEDQSGPTNYFHDSDVWHCQRFCQSLFVTIRSWGDRLIMHCRYLAHSYPMRNVLVSVIRRREIHWSGHIWCLNRSLHEYIRHNISTSRLYMLRGSADRTHVRHREENALEWTIDNQHHRIDDI